MDIESQVRCLAVIVAEVIDAVDQVRQAVADLVELHGRQLAFPVLNDPSGELGHVLRLPAARAVYVMPRDHLELARSSLTDALASLKAVRS